MKDMPSAAQTGGSTEPNGGVLKHEKGEIMDRSSPQQDINDVDSVTISLASKSLYGSESAPQKGESELCPYVCQDRCSWLLAFFCQSFVDFAAFWCIYHDAEPCVG